MQTHPEENADLGLHGLPRYVCPKYLYYGHILKHGVELSFEVESWGKKVFSHYLETAMPIYVRNF